MSEERRAIRSIICRISVIILIVAVMSMYLVCMSRISARADIDDVELFVIMYHNIIPDSAKANKYEIRVSDLEKDLRVIKARGYDVVVPSDIEAYQTGERRISRRAVMLTFDDGYYSYIDYLLPLLSRYDMRAVVSVVGEYTRLNKDRKDISRRYTYLDYDDIETLARSGRVEIGLHSYGLHHIKGRHNGASQMKGETDEDYSSRLIADTTRLTTRLRDIGVTSTIYTYPYGAYSRSSDEILRSIGIKCTLSCSEGINHITRDSSLNLMRRYNRSGLASPIDRTYPFFSE